MVKPNHRMTNRQSGVLAVSATVSCPLPGAYGRRMRPLFLIPQVSGPLRNSDYERKVLPDIGSAWISTPLRFVWRHLRRNHLRMKEIDHEQTETAYINPAAGQRFADL